MDYYILLESHREEYAWLNFNTPEVLKENIWKMGKGISMADDWPDSLVWKMAIQKGLELHDYVPNFDQLKVVSTRLKNFLIRRTRVKCEFYPMRVSAYRGKIMGGKYWAVNLLDSVNCVDNKRSIFHVDHEKDYYQIRLFIRLVLKKRKIPWGKQMFRLGEKKSVWIIREDLVAAFEAEEFKGYYCMPLKDYCKKFRNRFHYVPDPVAGY